MSFKNDEHFYLLKTKRSQAVAKDSACLGVGAEDGFAIITYTSMSAVGVVEAGASIGMAAGPLGAIVGVV